MGDRAGIFPQAPKELETGDRLGILLKQPRGESWLEWVATSAESCFPAQALAGCPVSPPSLWHDSGSRRPCLGGVGEAGI